MKVKINKLKKTDIAVKPEKVGISSEFIKLDSLLKFSMLVETGGEAKTVIQEGNVSVNGEVCIQRGKKIYPGDVVKLYDKRITIFREKTDG